MKHNFTGNPLRAKCVVVPLLVKIFRLELYILIIIYVKVT